MSFIQWLILGLVAYACGFSMRHFQFKNQVIAKEKILQFTVIFFVVSLVVFALLNLYALEKALDIAFIGVSSLVATGIFYYGLTADTSNNMKLPD